MLRLLLLRHAKAAAHNPAKDHERALVGRGRADAERLGRFIAGQTPAIEAAIHSGARRAKETLAIVLAELPRDIPVSIEPRLYEATTNAFLNAMRDLPSAATILVVGHNPSLAEAALLLAGKGEPDALRRMAAKFPTSGLAILDFKISAWPHIAAGQARLAAFITPALLDGQDE
jgi:phosphohistidine phosphatase